MGSDEKAEIASMLEQRVFFNRPKNMGSPESRPRAGSGLPIEWELECTKIDDVPLLLFFANKADSRLGRGYGSVPLKFALRLGQDFPEVDGIVVFNGKDNWTSYSKAECRQWAVQD
jgi:hypothetical protein